MPTAEANGGPFRHQYRESCIYLSYCPGGNRIYALCPAEIGGK